MGFLSGTSMIPAVGRGFYGWRMVAFASVVLALTGPGQTFGVSVFVDPMIQDLGISRTMMSGAYLVGTLVGAVALPWIGQAIDRYGVRRVMLVIGFLFGGLLISMATVSGLLRLTVGFVGIRMMGQGALSLVATTAIALWFTRKRGFAMGLVTAAGGMGMTLVPLAGERLIWELGWRTAWVVEGLVVWAVVVPVALFAIRNRPSDLGQHPDGDPAPALGHAEVWGVSRRSALRTGFFWLIAAAVGTIAALTTAVVFHQIDLLGSRGLTPAAAAANFIPQTLATVAVTLAAGVLADRISARAMLISSMMLIGSGLILGTVASPGWTAIGFGMMIGASGGVIRVVEATELPKYFGTLHIGAIRGVVTTVGVASAAVGPLVFALMHGISGTYTTVLLASLVLPITVIVASSVVPLPRHAIINESGEARLIAEG